MRDGKLNDSQWGNRMRGEGIFADQIEQMFEVARRKAGIPSGDNPNFPPPHFVVPLARNFRYSPDVQDLVEDFLQYLRHERGQAEHTQKTYAALLDKFITWAQKHGLNDWKAVELKHLMSFLQHERERPLADEPLESTKRLSSESVYLEIAALRAFYRFAETEKLLPANVAENLSLPRRWQRLPKALSNQEIDKLLTPELPETPEKSVRPGGPGTGLRFRLAARRTAQPSPRTNASGGRIHQCHRQREQGTRRAGRQKSH